MNIKLSSALPSSALARPMWKLPLAADVAAETADIILVNSDPNDVVNMIAFGKVTYRKMIQNLFWAVVYNVVAIPLAAGVLSPHFILRPVAAVLMSLSTIIMAINAQFLRTTLK